MKLPRSSLIGVALAFAMVVDVRAEVIFSDDFNRGVSNTVGNGWNEVEHNPGDVSLVVRSGSDHELKVSDEDPNGIAARVSGISTVGYTNIALSYEWKPTGHTELDDVLWVEWRDGSSPQNQWMTIGNHLLSQLSAHALALEFISDGAGVADFELRFRVAVNANNEGAYVDNVLLVGDPLRTAPQSVPEPGSLALAGVGLAMLAWGRRGSRRANTA